MELSKIKGFGKVNITKLNEANIFTVEEMMAIPPPQYADLVDVDNDTANKHFRMARAAWVGDRDIFKKASEYEEELEIDRIKTGSSALDKFFLGGLECRATTELFGEFGCGKTQLCHSFAVQAQKPVEEGGLDCKVIWISTENTFEKKRITEITNANNMDLDKVLDNITVAEAFNSVDQYDILRKVQQMIVKDPSYRLIIIDSATGLFRQDFSGMGHLSERQKYLDRFLTLGSNIAKLHNIAMIWTNQIYVSPTFFGDGVTPVGGSKIAHKSTYRVKISKSGDYRIAKMIDSPKDAQTEVMFGLSRSGVVDMDVAKKEATALKKEKLEMKKQGKAGKTIDMLEAVPDEGTLFPSVQTP